MADVFADLLGAADAFTRPVSGAAAFMKQRRRLPKTAHRSQLTSANELLFARYGDSASSSESEGMSSSSGRRRRKRPRSDTENPAAPRKRQRRNDGTTMSAQDMCKFMFSQFYATGGPWIVVSGRRDVRMSNPGEEEPARRFGVLGHPPSSPSLESADTDVVQNGGSGRQRGPPSDEFSSYQQGEAEDWQGHAGDGPITGQFNRNYRYDAVSAARIQDGAHAGNNSGEVMMMHSSKPLAYNAVMHPTHRRELSAKFDRFKRDGFDPERELCPVCLYGACDRQAALAGNSGGSNNAVANFFVMYSHDRENVNEQVLHTSLANYWNHYIFRPHRKVGLVNGCQIRPSHVEYHFNYCMDCSNPVAVLRQELRETSVLLKTMREQGLYLEALNYGRGTGRIFVSPLVARQVQMQSGHLMALAQKLQAVNWNEKTLARLTASLQETADSRVQFDSGQSSYAGALNQFGKNITQKKAQQSISLL